MPHGDTSCHCTRAVLIYAFKVVTSRLTVAVGLKQIFITAKLADLEIWVFVGANNQITCGIVVINTLFVDEGRDCEDVVPLKLNLRKKTRQTLFSN